MRLPSVVGLMAWKCLAAVVSIAANAPIVQALFFPHPRIRTAPICLKMPQSH